MAACHSSRERASAEDTIRSFVYVHCFIPSARKRCVFTQSFDMHNMTELIKRMICVHLLAFVGFVVCRFSNPRSASEDRQSGQHEGGADEGINQVRKINGNVALQYSCVKFETF
jgi:hypothetical protein